MCRNAVSTWTVFRSGFSLASMTSPSWKPRTLTRFRRRNLDDLPVFLSAFLSVPCGMAPVTPPASRFEGASRSPNNCMALVDISLLTGHAPRRVWAHNLLPRRSVPGWMWSCTKAHGRMSVGLKVLPTPAISRSGGEPAGWFVKLLPAAGLGPSPWPLSPIAWTVRLPVWWPSPYPRVNTHGAHIFINPVASR
jgi:hypothetical protein